MNCDEYSASSQKADSQPGRQLISMLGPMDSFREGWDGPGGS